jgi:predicted nucleic acid-binding protein
VKASENIIVFLDTEVIEHENYNFESRKLSSLKKCNEQGIVDLYMTSINVNEVEKRIEKKIKHAEAAIKSVRKDTLILHNIEQYKETILEKRIFEAYHRSVQGHDIPPVFAA